jgi:hypothetical protein
MTEQNEMYFDYKKKHDIKFQSELNFKSLILHTLINVLNIILSDELIMLQESYEDKLND